MSNVSISDISSIPTKDDHQLEELQRISLRRMKELHNLQQRRMLVRRRVSMPLSLQRAPLRHHRRLHQRITRARTPSPTKRRPKWSRKDRSQPWKRKDHHRPRPANTTFPTWDKAIHSSPIHLIRCIATCSFQRHPTTHLITCKWPASRRPKIFLEIQTPKL